MRHPQLRLSHPPHSFHLEGREDVIFVHIKKTGGTSIRDALPFQEIDIHRSLKHYSVRHIIDSIGQEAWDKAFSFAFVRNPWTRIHSLYRYLKAENNHIVAHLPDFKSFLRVVLDRNASVRSNHLPAGLPQVDWLQDHQGQIQLSFLGRQENLEADFNVLLSALNLPQVALPALNRTPSPSPQDRLAPYDREMKSWMASLYERDFDTFGYPLGLQDIHIIPWPELRRTIHPEFTFDAESESQKVLAAKGVRGPWVNRSIHDWAFNLSPQALEEMQFTAYVLHPVERLQRMRNGLEKWGQSIKNDEQSSLEKLKHALDWGLPIPHRFLPQVDWIHGRPMVKTDGIRIVRIETLPEYKPRTLTWTDDEIAMIEEIYRADLEALGYRSKR